MANYLLDAAIAVPVVVLAQAGRLIDAVLAEALVSRSPTVAVGGLVVIVVLVVVSAYDAAEGFLKARRAALGRAAARL